MKLFFLAQRTTVLIPSGPAHDINRKHLFILLTGPMKYGIHNEKHVLTVSVCSITDDKYDRACVLNKGDHSFIKHPSYVLYQKLMIRSCHEIEDAVGKNHYISKGTMDVEVFKKVIDGLFNSKHTAKKYINFYNNFTSLPISE